MDTEKLREDFFFLIGFILTSMQGLYHEPADYGMYRLLDVGGRLLSIIENHGLSDDFLHKLGQEIEAEKAESMDGDRQKITISRLTLAYTDELQRRLSIETH